MFSIFLYDDYFEKYKLILVYWVGQLGEPEKTHGRKYHLIPHQGDGIPWGQNFSGSYEPGESTKPLLQFIENVVNDHRN